MFYNLQEATKSVQGHEGGINGHGAKPREQRFLWNFQTIYPILFHYFAFTDKAVTDSALIFTSYRDGGKHDTYK